ncbi:MAG: metal ABC transporter solute-binding protein, Zn/Mn family [Christensenellales bacterium]
MKKTYLVMLAALMILLVSSCNTNDTDANKNTKLTVAVGIVPEAAFVQKVAGDLVDVVTMVPPGNSPENYQPTSGDMASLSDATVYFTLHTPTEEARILPNIKSFNEDIVVVDLREAAAAVYPLLPSSHHHEEDSPQTTDTSVHDEAEEEFDPHVWLSPRRVVVMVQAIADELSAIDQTNSETYKKNAAAYIAELEALDKEIKQTVSGLKNKTFLIYHPAYGYFADDYGLTMVSIEIEGKQATAKEMQAVIDSAREKGIHTIFYQEELSESQALTIAEEIGGKTMAAAPLSADYAGALRDFTNALVASEE